MTDHCTNARVFAALPLSADQGMAKPHVRVLRGSSRVLTD